MTMPRIRQLVEQRIGLDPDSLGVRAFETAVNERGKTYPTLDDYAAALESKDSEFATLIERLVVSETWFYRGGTVFEILAKHITEQSRRKRVRILCLPCSSGEEPYSLAMALLEAGVPASQFEIDAVDLSTKAIAAAMKGLYREFSFRELPASLKQKYFVAADGVWSVRQDVRDCVRFHSENASQFHGGIYDVILCRNLLIYLTPASRRDTVDRLLAKLSPEGILGLGHAEASALNQRGFASFGPVEAFLFTRVKSLESASPPHSNPVTVADDVRPIAFEPTDRRVAAIPGVERQTLEQVRQLADGGRLAEAMAACLQLIAGNPSAASYTLLGAIHQASGNDSSARVAFRKALYLDPDNKIAIAHSMVSADESGNASRSAVLKAKLDRLAGGSA